MSSSESPEASVSAASRAESDSDADSVSMPVLPLVSDATATPPVTGEKRTRSRTAAAVAAANVAAAANASAANETADNGKAAIPSASRHAGPKKRKLAGSFASVVASACAASGVASSVASLSSSLSPSSRAQNAAAARIQALVRGAKARLAHKTSVLWNAWNELDWAEEQALMNTHDAYETLKKAVATRVKHDEAEAKSGKGRTKRGGKSAKGRASEKVLTAEEEESACGLLLRDKDPITFTWVAALMEHFRQNKTLPLSLVHKLLKRVEPLLRPLPNIINTSCTARLTVVGDLHGQLDDLLAIFKLTGLPSARNRYLFNGDFVDRGQHSVECILTLLAWKALMPNDVMLNRGNHEASDINARDGFERECMVKYDNDVSVFTAFSRVFSTLPLAHVIDGQVFVTHGGLFPDCPSLADIQAVDRFHEVPPTGSTMEYALWSDPQPAKGRDESPRGAGLLFGPDVTREFLKKNKLQLIVRSHECMPNGYKLHHQDQVITVFSASNYCGTVGNDGALVVFERDGESALAAQKAAKAAPPSPSPSSSTLAVASAAAGASPVLRSPRLAARGLASAQQAPPPPSPSVKDASSPSSLASLKRSFITFYASKKEKQSAYRVVGASRLESDTVSKLLHLIGDRRLQLTDYWSKHAATHSTGVRTVSRAVWASGLKTVLGLKTIPFLEFQDLLGLPKLGVDGKPRGAIDPMAFLARFRPVNLVVLRAQRRLAASQSQSQSQSLEPTQETQELPEEMMDDLVTGDSSALVDDEALAHLQSILDLLHRNRVELESLFRYLDVDGDESVSHDEFREGIKALEGQLKIKISNAQMDSLLNHIDVDGDGQISYAEFLSSFELRDPALQTHLERSRSIREERSGPTAKVVRHQHEDVEAKTHVYEETTRSDETKESEETAVAATTAKRQKK